MSPQKSPRFTHDCENCEYLGTIRYKCILTQPAASDGVGRPQINMDYSLEGAFRHDTYDLYFCFQVVGFPTVIARYSSEPRDYKSGVRFADTDPEIAIAKKIAVQRGLLAEGKMDSDDNQVAEQP